MMKTQSSGLLTVYARHSSNGASVEIFRDAEAKNLFCRYPRHYASCPTKRNRRVTLNCYTWKLIWL